MSDLVIPGLSRWMPLDLDADPDEYAARLAAEYPATASAELVASGVAGMAARFRQARDEADREGDSVLVAAWLFLRSDEDLTPLAHATLQGLPLDGADPTVDGVLQRLVGEDEIYQQPEVRELATASGPATYVRYRPVHHVGGERRVHERASVVWLRPAQNLVVLLSGYSNDLLEAAEMPDAVAALAEGVSGL